MYNGNGSNLSVPLNVNDVTGTLVVKDRVTMIENFAMNHESITNGGQKIKHLIELFEKLSNPDINISENIYSPSNKRYNTHSKIQYSEKYNDNERSSVSLNIEADLNIKDSFHSNIETIEYDANMINTSSNISTSRDTIFEKDHDNKLKKDIQRYIDEACQEFNISDATDYSSISTEVAKIKIVNIFNENLEQTITSQNMNENDYIQTECTKSNTKSIEEQIEDIQSILEGLDNNKIPDKSCIPNIENINKSIEDIHAALDDLNYRSVSEELNISETEYIDESIEYIQAALKDLYDKSVSEKLNTLEAEFVEDSIEDIQAALEDLKYRSVSEELKIDETEFVEDSVEDIQAALEDLKYRSVSEELKIDETEFINESIEDKQTALQDIDNINMTEEPKIDEIEDGRFYLEEKIFIPSRIVQRIDKYGNSVMLMHQYNELNTRSSNEKFIELSSINKENFYKNRTKDIIIYVQDQNDLYEYDGYIEKNNRSSTWYYFGRIFLCYQI